ncbi:unnamed protein product [Vicia faba]|uniref:Beta-glucosidase 12-like n=1 Tax=Vicia faba TaxID=3906 RepID=A0AAV0ZS31_VICFA|nr:unnamed protein product [Vicia faba]
MWFNVVVVVLFATISFSLFISAVSLNRSSFPSDFLFGTASSAYQYEGAAREGGKGPSIWDTFTHSHPDRIAGHSNGDVAVDSYHRYKEDVAMMKDIGFNAYRFSIAWSRILPRGNLNGGINQEGVIYYNNLINDLISNGQKPFITLFHSDLPQALEDEYGGFLSPKIEQDFADYAEVCFREFGDRVKHWITLNEPLLYSTGGYGNGGSPPSRCSKWVANCNAGDSSTEPYVVSHHLILAHAAAVKVYRTKFQNTQKGQIGVTLNSAWLVPLSLSKADRDAASRGLDFMYGWFMEPLNSGLNYYTSTYATDIPCQGGKPSVFTDNCVRFTSLRNGVLIGPKAASDWLYVYPPGIQGLLQYTKEKFNNPIIYITENGIDEVDDGKRSLNDKVRIDYISHHLLYLQRAIMNGVRVKGYFAWSLLDNFEWNAGYTLRFGLVYVDYKNGLRRYRKRSALWFKLFLRK